MPGTRIPFNDLGPKGGRPKPSPPPSGFAGQAQQVPASLPSAPAVNVGYAMFSRGGRTAPTRRRRRRRAKAVAAPRRRRRRTARRSRGKAARFVKGSAAAKRHMARLRRMRRR